MSEQEVSVTKKPGRPSKEPTTVVRLPEATVAAAETWAADQPDKPKRSEAIARLVEKALRER